jgi:Domain of unknown function (DUF397)
MSSEWDAVKFFKATGSGDHGCVEVAFHGGRVGVRDTKDHGAGPVLAFTAYEWEAFIAGAKAGKLDRPE